MPPWSRSANCVHGKTPLVGQAMMARFFQADWKQTYVVRGRHRAEVLKPGQLALFP